MLSVRFAITAICGLGLAVYSNTFLSSFHLDDFIFIVDNRLIKDLSDLGAIWSVWPTRFLTVFSLGVNYHLHQLAVGGYHLFNLTFHIGAAILVWRLIVLTFNTPGMRGNVLSPYSKEISLFAALIFVAHPLQTEAVTYIWQRSVLLATFFYLATLILYVRWRLSSAAGFYYKCSLLTAVLALLSKETSMTLPLALLLYEYYFFRLKKGEWKKIIVRVAPFFALGAALLVLMILFQPANPQIKGSYFLHLFDNKMLFNYYFLTECRVWLTYLRLLFVPIHQNIDYNYPIIRSWLDPAMLSSLIFLIVLAAVAIKIRHKHILTSFGILWFYVMLLPDSSFVPLADVIFEYRVYPSMFGFALALTSLLYYFWGDRRRWLVRGGLAILVGLYAIMAYQRNSVWKDEVTLWTDVIHKSSYPVRAYNSLGTVYLERGDLEKAMNDFNTALRLKPDFVPAYVNRGLVYLQKGEKDRALEDFNTALSIDPTYAPAYYDRGSIYYKQGDLKNAKADFDKAKGVNPSL
jgi:tetratricopeptide (TPR) repeat protein